ncbi:CheA signal transduction histidine kinase [Coraliomargarita akajimensis DSM 45221]|uniref:histidine kinase n=2 Tax=Coraliomargarita TaxID=442430 RepID=D5ELN1_CORAD|nr:CheA signal transduction histidine kinase [Coraliomargarita akajimensis DSM 45221]
MEAPMITEYTFPETLLDADFRDSFLGDLSIAKGQLSQALAQDSPAESAAISTMDEIQAAMHMLRGAAGAIHFKLAFDYAEMFHRAAEIGQSFAGNLQSEFHKIYAYLKKAEDLLSAIENDVVQGSFSSAPSLFAQLSESLLADYGDYFADSAEPPSSAKEMERQTDSDDDLESFLAMVNASPQPPNSEPTTSAPDLGGDVPADWDVLQYFYQEADENMTAFEQAMLAMEKGSPDAHAEVLRLTHSTKGAANSMGMFRIAHLMHETEALFERIQQEDLVFSASDYTAILKTTDLIRSILQETETGAPIKDLNRDIENQISLYAQLGHPHETLSEQATTNPQSESTIAIANTSRSTPSTALLSDEDPVQSVSNNTFRIDADKVDDLMNTVGELIISRTRLTQKMDALLALCQELSKSRLRMRDTLTAFSERFEYSKQRKRATEFDQSAEDSYADFAPLELDRYDEFNILSRQVTEIGEDTDLAIKEILAGGQSVQLESNNLSGYISQIQSEIANTRLAPISMLYKRLERSVRDAAAKLDRSVSLITTGDDLLIDKAILDDLFEPMLHMVRNCVVHAFTDATDTENSIAIHARQQGGRIQINVQDNGQGIHYDKIRAVAVQKQLPNAAQLTNDELTELIFHPGFTTTDEANEVSGRGIGLDAVRAQIETFGGSINVRSHPGKGTTFALHLPLTLAIDRGMYFYVGGHLYAIFMAAVEQVYFSRDLSFERSGEKELLILQDSSIPVIDLREQFGHSIDPNNHRESIILCRYLSTRIALKVDRVFYQDDVVVKSLGKFFEHHRFFSSATIHGDGEVVPILDISRLSNSQHTVTEHPSNEFDLADESSNFKQQILVVDDSISVRKVCEDYLSTSGYTVETANDGLEALNRVKAKKYDLILSDLEMPRLNGLDLLAELKRRPQTSDIPVLIITSRTTEKHQQKALSLGAKECVGKPFTKEQLLETLEKHLLQLA